MVLNDFTTEVQTHTGGFSCWFRSEEWIENLIDDGVLDTNTIVKDSQLDMIVDSLDGQFYFWLVFLALGFLNDSIDRIAQETHQCLAQLFGITVNRQLAFWHV